jgi:hypothetical protein
MNASWDGMTERHRESQVTLRSVGIAQRRDTEPRWESKKGASLIVFRDASGLTPAVHFSPRCLTPSAIPVNKHYTLVKPTAHGVARAVSAV